MVEDRLRDLHADVHGGNGVEWERSLRGRVHKLENVQATTEALAAAARDLRRVNERRWSRVEKTGALLFAGLAVVPPWVLLIVTYWP